MATLTLTARLEAVQARNTAPAAAHTTYTPATGDAAVMAVWGLTPAEWAAMDDAGRVFHRLYVARAL